MIWLKLIRRDIRFNAFLWLLSLIGVAAGVAGWVGMEIATNRASSSFEQSIKTTLGSATHVIEGRSGSVPNTVYRKLARRHDLSITPLIEEYGRLSSDEYVRLLGIDPLSYGQFRSSDLFSGLPVEEFLAGNNKVLLSSDFRGQFEKGDRVEFSIDNEPLPLMVAGFLKDSDQEQTFIVDIGWAQNHLLENPRISRILLRTTPEVVDTIKQSITSNFMVLPRGQRTRSVRSMLGAFQWNLRALSFLSLFVGAFLVYSTMYLYTSRQVNMISMLKTIGVSDRSVGMLLFGGLLLLGIVGSLLGIILGLVMSVPMSTLVGQTVDQLYVPLFASTRFIPLQSILLGFGLGVTMSFLGGFKPVWDNLGISPRAWNRSNLVSENSESYRLTLFGFGLLLLLLALAFLTLFNHILVGFLSCFMIALGGSLCGPLTLNVLTNFPLPGIWGRMASRNIRFHDRRTGIMVAVLIAAFSMVLAVSFMVNSFRGSVHQWIENVVKADYYVRSAPGSANRAKPPLQAEFLSDLRRRDGVEAVGLLAEKKILTETGAPLTLRGIEPGVLQGRITYQFNESLGDPWKDLADGTIWLSEPGAFRMGLGAGDTLSLPHSGGTHPVTISAVYNDYSTEWAVAYMPLSNLQRQYPNATVTSAAVFTDDQSVERSLSSLVNRYDYYLESRGTIRRRALKAFDRTFAVTDVMNVVSALVAGIGLLILLISFTEIRHSIFGRMSALGARRGQIIQMVALESLLVTFSAVLVAIPTGTVLSYVLVEFINRESFGWMIEFSFSVGPLVKLVGLSLLTLIVALSHPVYTILTTPLNQFLSEGKRN